MKTSTSIIFTMVVLFIASFVASSYAAEDIQEKFRLENEHLIVSVGENNLFSLTDKKTGVLWHPDPWKGTTGEIKVTYPANLFDKQAAEEKPIRASVDINKAREMVCRRKGPRTVQWISSGFTLEGRLLKGRVVFEMKLAKDKPIIEIELTELEIERKDITLRSFHFLPRWFSLKLASDTGYLVVPLSQGYIFPVGNVGLDRIDWLSSTWGFGQRAFSRADHPYLNFFGMVNGDSSLMMRLEDVYDTDVQVHGNQVGGWRKPRISTVYPIVLPIMGELGHSRKFVVEVIPNGSYVDMAKRYRSWLKSIGMYKSLKEKIRDLPSVKKLLGTPIVFVNPGYLKTIKSPNSDPRLTGGEKFTGTFKGIPKMMRSLKEEGVNRAFIMIWCWERAGGGFEEPDHWPPNEKLGGLVEFKKLFSRQLRKEFPEYIMGFYNIYNDMYDNAPSFDKAKILVNQDGSLNRSGLWHGGVARVICPTKYLDFAEKDFAAYQRELEQLDCMLYDNYVFPRECYSPDHPLTRAESAKAKKDFIDWTVDKGLITGVEFTRDWITPNIHYCDGSVGAYGRNTRNPMHENIVPIPLWDLVFHESVVNYWWHWNNYVFSTTYVMNRQYTWMDMVLQDILCANPGTWSIHPEIVDYWSRIMGQVAPTQSKISKSLAHVEMIGHEFLERSCMVQKTIWADGTEIYVNFRDKEFTKGNIKLPAKSFYLTGSPELGVLKGTMVEGFRLD